MARLAPATTTRFWPLVLSATVLGGILASCTATARVSDLYMALDGNGDRKRNVFFTDTKEIHCVIEVGIGRRGATVAGIIRQNQSYDFVADRFFDVDATSANGELSPTPQEGIQKLDLQLAPTAPDGTSAEGAPYPPGRFQCEAYLDGELEKVAIFNIDFPPCPTAIILPGAMCFGFYKNGDVCPRNGVTSRDPVNCRCSSLKGWECDK